MAHAATQTVFMGTPPSAQKALQKAGADANQFFPTAIKVHVGDTVKFTPVGFHSAEFPAAGKAPTGLLAPAGTVSGANDAAGNPFWFNGLPQLGFAPPLVTSGFGKSFTVPSANGVRSGLPLVNKPKPMSVKFTKAGVYTYYCNVHHGMKGTVSVVAKAKKVPTAKAIGLLVNAQVKAAKAIAAALPKTPVPANTVLVGPEKGGVTLYTFLPGTLSVKPGTTVTFTMPVNAREDHTASTGPGDPNDQKVKSYLGDLAAGFNAPVIPGQATYSSEAPGTTASLSPTLHGNGFWSSGVMDAVAASPPAQSSTVTFSTAGTYTFHCLIHTFMHGQVVVG
ncbi:plastocyanin/azurin family copper-binding protein [Paraconexibacter antarcticus]|uniref:Plastocyanin/azurin family copper-binding protein n=1 Tax=Paraconexibacter antarcticus TaxID=2949664 RepID=A0ABY5E2R1_9ACTN|nr:plastocyanin/azurin family copper-binding protein [Paraconexibacter antarcticus]UTI67119.1 plastocyanin/azurin family copper-binding protein [Paraconexibacter antarcticus]